MRGTGERGCCLIIENLRNMKKILLFLGAILLLASCSAQLTEKVETRFPNGKPQMVHYYDRNDRCVKEVEYYDSGQVKMEGGMKDGKMEGEWTAYFIDGRVQSHGFFKDGKRTGEAQVFYANGNKYEEGSYKDGKHVGKWKFYDEQGFLIKEVDFGEGEGE